MGATSPATISREQLKAGVDDLLDAIVNGSDEHWQAYASRLAHERALGARLGLFKPWSVHNTFFLQAQVGNRSSNVKGLFAGVDQWRKRGRSVVDGAKPYVIYGPPSFIVRQPQHVGTTTVQAQAQAQAHAQAPAAGQPAGTAAVQRFFRKPPVIEVYDWTQTISNDPDYVEPDWQVPLAFGDLDTLELLASTAGLSVTFADVGARDERGWLNADGITVDSSQPVGNQISTLLHELAHHHLGHLEQLTSTARTAAQDEIRAVCEQEAALAQYLGMKMLGLDEGVGNDVTTAAGAYLRSWMRPSEDGTLVPVAGHKTKRKLLLKRFDAAFKAADKVVAAYTEALNERVPTAVQVF